MTPEQQALLDKAQPSLQAAKLLAAERMHDFAASRAYYAMFYLAEAFLLEKGLAFSTHAAVISAFGREFAKGGALPRELHRFLIDAEESRAIADYDPQVHVPEEQARQHIVNAEEFLSVAERILGGNRIA